LPSAFQQVFLDLLESSRVLPKQVLSNRPEVLDLLGPVAGRIGFELASSKKLAALEEAFDSMYKMMQGNSKRSPGSLGFKVVRYELRFSTFGSSSLNLLSLEM
jgi:hypothetical protein